MQPKINLKKKEILLFVTTWMKLEGVMLSEISQTEKGEYIMISLILESKNVELIETVSRLVVTSLGVGEGAQAMGLWTRSEKQRELRGCTDW